MNNKKVFLLSMGAMAIAMNIVLGTVVTRLNIPLLFLDTIGTIFIAVLFGPWQAATVGSLTNILTPILSGSPKDIPYFIINAAVGLIVGYMARKFKFNVVNAIASGLILSIVCPILGTLITVGFFGGLTGSVNDYFTLFLQKSGMKIFTAAFIPRITGNFIDKIGSCLLVLLAMKYVPVQYKNRADLSA
ncbi:ECF transporter S component [Clostridium swellfunianum]|uniref:CD3073 family putative ECF transporter S component n=1 Tax=Clostridium swellfunianum TaxID=1367462 RepID=UPI00202F0D02|nr:CD3073 family putative ECF transporter S component [Clostridium swellfunianum]MCM0647907.1 ECF transporter S component [Clostridium swellfunianum]